MSKYIEVMMSTPVLWCLRIGAFLIVLFLMSWIFSDVEFTSLVMLNIPLYYPYFYQNKEISVLFLPIIFNIALWRLSDKSYAFIRVVLYIELCKTVIIMLLSFIGAVSTMIFVMPANYFFSAKISFTYFCFLSYMMIRIKTDYYKTIFREKCKLELSTTKIVIMVYVAMYALFAIESFIQFKVNSLTADIKQYYVEGQHSSENDIGYVNRLALSDNGNCFVNVFREGKNKGKVGIFNTKTGEKIKILDIENVNYCVFAPDGQSLLLTKDGDDKQIEVKFEEWAVSTGEKKNVYSDVENVLNNDGLRQFYLNKISFSIDGRYFSTEGKGVSIWDYQTGELISFYDHHAKTKSLAWLSARDYLVIEIPDVNWVNKKEEKKKKSVYHEKIQDDGKVIRTEKEKMAQDFCSKTDGLRGINILIKKGVQQGNAAVIISGEPENGIWYQRGYIDVWNVNEEQLIFSLQSNYKIVNTVFHPDGEHIIVFEELRDQRGRITLWNMNTKKKEKMVSISKINNVIDMKLIDQGEKIILLKNPISVIDFKE